MTNPLAYADLLAYGMQSPIEFGMLQGFDSMDPSTWSETKKKAYLAWGSATETPGATEPMMRQNGANKFSFREPRN